MRPTRQTAVDELWGLGKRVGAVIAGLAAFVGGWTYLGFPTFATDDDLKAVDDRVGRIQADQKTLHQIVWTDKLLDYQGRLADLEREIADRKEANGDVDPVFYRQRRLLLGSIREAQRKLLIYDGQP